MKRARDIKLMLADVDGTLLTEDKVLTKAAKQAVRDLHRAGIGLAITSGRPPRGMKMLVKPLGLRTPIAGFNGGIFAKSNLEPIEVHALEARTAKTAIKLLLEQDLDAWVYTKTAWLIRDSNAPHVAREAWTVKFKAKVVRAFTDAHLKEAVKIVGVSDDHALVAKCEKLLQRALGKRANAVRSQPYYLDVTHPKANKGAVVTTLARLLGIAPRHIATIGDMPNDILMFRRSGFAIAMGNAAAGVKKHADAVTDSYTNEGFAKAVKKFLLSQQAPKDKAQNRRGSRLRQPVDRRRRRAAGSRART